MSVEVNIKISDLEFIRFDFWLKDTTLYLDRMVILNRETSRHKLHVDFRNSYSRIDNRDFGIKEEPDVPIEVQMEALRIVREMIKVERWKNE